MSENDNINFKQLRTLVQAFSKINTRGKSGKTKYGRMVSIFFSYGISSYYLAMILSKFYFEPVYLTLTISVTIYIGLFTVLNSYSLILLDTDEEQILSQFPLSSKTIFLARSVNILLYVLLISVPFIAPLAFYYYLHTGSIPLVASYVFILILGAIWTTGYFIVLYNTLLSRLEYSTRTFSLIQIILVFFLLFLYQALPSVAEANILWNDFSSTRMTLALPPLWFVALHGMISGTEIIPMQAVHAFLAAATVLLLVIIMRTKWMLLPDIKKRPSLAPVRGNNPLYKILNRISSREKAARAGFNLFARLFARERSLRIQIIPIIMIPIAIAVYGLLSGELNSPFHGRILAWRSRLHIPVIIFFLFAARHLEQAIRRAVQPRATWLLALQNPYTLKRYSTGVKNSIFWLIYIPQGIVLLLIFSFVMPLAESILQAAFLVVFARFQSATLAVFRSHIPFSETEPKLATLQRFAQIFVLLPYLISAIILHSIASHTIAYFVILLSLLEILTFISIKISRTKKYAFTT